MLMAGDCRRAVDWQTTLIIGGQVSDHPCKFERELPEFMATVKANTEHIDQRITEYITRANKIDDEQFGLLRKQGESLAAVEREVSIITSKMKNGGIPATMRPSMEHNFWQTLAATKKKYLLFFAVASSSLILFVIDFAIDFLVHFRVAVEKLSGIPFLKILGLG